LPPPLDGLLAWAVREGVTNVIRHSGARRCEIRVTRLGDLVRLVVSDDGRSADGGAPKVGSGLAGLAERAAAHGAELVAGARPQGGFELVLIVPAPAPAAGDG
jgi:two-component system sensor histidine kinase DesK